MIKLAKYYNGTFNIVQNGESTHLDEHRKRNILAHILHKFTASQQAREFEEFDEFRAFPRIFVESQKMFPWNIANKIDPKPTPVLCDWVSPHVMLYDMRPICHELGSLIKCSKHVDRHV